MKRIIVNVLLALIIDPIITLSRHYYNFEIRNDHSAYSGTFMEYVWVTKLSIFVLGPFLLLILVLLPYNLIIIRRKYTYFKKVLIFVAIMIIDVCLISTYTNVLAYPYWKNIYYLLFFVIYGLVFAGMIHIFVDRKEIQLHK